VTRLMYDAVTPANIPANAAMVAGYVDGRYAWSAADWARFPNAVHVPIAVFPTTNSGVVLDVEQGDATPQQAPGWVQMRRAAGVDPTVYCSEDAWPAVRAAFTAAGVPQPHYWVAAYPGEGAVIPVGAVAHQYQDAGPYDLSVVADFWPGVDQGEDMTPEQDQMLRDVHEQLMGNGSRGGGNPDGWPLLPPTLQGAEYAGGPLTPVDFIREMHRELVQRLPNRVDGKSADTVAGYSANADAYGYKILAAVKGLSTGAVDIPALAAAIEAALPGDLVKALGEKLAA
jgi:hypothetical protein